MLLREYPHSSHSTFTQVNTFQLSSDPISTVPQSLKHTAVISFDESWVTNLQPRMKDECETSVFALCKYAGLSERTGRVLAAQRGER